MLKGQSTSVLAKVLTDITLSVEADSIIIIIIQRLLFSILYRCFIF